jgi:hypothetical protein
MARWKSNRRPKRKPKPEPVSVGLTLMIQRTVDAPSEEEYIKMRDKLVTGMERAGWSVSVENEDDDESPEDDEEAE